MKDGDTLAEDYNLINKRKSSQMKPTPRELQETHKTYEKLVEHLISEGYADSKESADDIIRGMSETWFNLIVND